VHSASKQRLQQATALVSLSTCGAMTGFSLAQASIADITSPTSIPVHLVAFSKPGNPAASADARLRSSIVNVANYYLRMAQTKTPAEMEAIIWQGDSVDGVDHGESCAAFASLTLEMGAQAAGQQSWVSGGTSYPWPLHSWADVRVDPNPDSMNIVSVLQDAQAHGRWHPLGDGYQPQPGDWVLFDGHVEVVTKYADGVLYTIGGDSLPDFSVNAHSYPAPLSAQGVQGFVDNGSLTAATGSPAGQGAQQATNSGQPAGSTGMRPGQAAIPGTPLPSLGLAFAGLEGSSGRQGSAPSQRPAAAAQMAAAGTAVIPGAEPISRDALFAVATSGPGSGAGRAARATGSDGARQQASSARPYGRNAVAPATSGATETTAQQAFINEVAPGAIAAERSYGVPASVTIAQAIEESGWGQSELAAADNNLFGIKGAGPAGSALLSTEEYENGQWVTIAAPFRVYNNVAQSITDHAQLLATDPVYQQAMADRHTPDAFANDLTGVYATDPDYGAKLVALMQLYDLYRYDATTTAAAPAGPSRTAPATQAAAPSVAPSPAPAGAVAHAAPAAAAPAAAAPGASGDAAGDGPDNVPQGGSSIPGAPYTYVAARGAAPAATGREAGRRGGVSAATAPRITSRAGQAATSRYVAGIPRSVSTAFITTAKVSLLRSQPLYRDVAADSGIRWQLLAACDWMQCQAEPRHSPVHGEKLGTANPDGTAYFTRSEALAQCAGDLVELAWAVYGIDLTARRKLSVRDLARVFAAFRWGGLLRAHRISAMEFPYSVAGLTAQHLKMRWPAIDDSNAPDKPGTRFRMPFGAVPVALWLNYPARA
jgi:flagellum-specific peptidoglycan hydrolase FlgJ